MSVTGRPPRPGPPPAPDRKRVQVYLLPETHVLVRLAAEARGVTIGRLVDEMVAAEAARHGVALDEGSS